MNIVFLVVITLLGAFLRLSNLSPFKFYPDSYQNLIVAQNILNYHSVFGKLGNAGMFYPDFIMWTRPGYPLIINLVSLITNNPVLSAQIINFVTGVLAIPVAYLFIRKVFHSNTAGLIACLITAISFNLIVWGGFIYTESLGILLILILLWRLFENSGNKSKLADINDFMTGLIFCLSTFTRYEYSILIIPITYLVLTASPSPYKKLTNIFVSGAFFSSIILSQLYPIQELGNIISLQLSRLLLIFLTSAVSLISAIILYKFKFFRLIKSGWVNFFIAGFLWSSALLMVVQLLFGEKIVPLYYQLTGIRNFFTNDFLLGFFTLIGITLMLKDKSLKTLVYFVIISAFLLLPVYYNINPQMQRYTTHLLPLLLIPASFAGWRIFEFFQMKSKTLPKYPVLFLLIFILLLCQIIFSFDGIKDWNNGSWFRESYEEKSAKLLNEKLPKDEDYLLISALPEAYYFFTGRSTQSILTKDQSPFLYIDPGLDSREVYVISDMGMSDLFPNFNNFLSLNLKSEKIFEYWVHETYHYSIKSKLEDQPVMVYKTTIGKLKDKINQKTQLPSQ